MGIYQNILFWLSVGMVVGVIVNFMFPALKKISLGTIGAAMVGSFVGGVLYTALKIGYISSHIDLNTLIVAFMGSLALVFFVYSLVKIDSNEKTS